MVDAFCSPMTNCHNLKKQKNKRKRGGLFELFSNSGLGRETKTKNTFRCVLDLASLGVREETGSDFGNERIGVCVCVCLLKGKDGSLCLFKKEIISNKMALRFEGPHRGERRTGELRRSLHDW